MIYIVSPQNLQMAVLNSGENRWFAYHSDAKLHAIAIANQTGEPQFIYCVEQADCIDPQEREPEPEKTFELTFDKIDKTHVTVKAKSLEEAIKIGRAKIGQNWDFYIGNEVTND